MTVERDLKILSSLDAISLQAAEQFFRLSAAAIKDHGRFTVALAGGNTPRGAYSRIQSTWKEQASPIDWSRAHIFWGDERNVSSDDPLSNYRMAEETLLAHVPIPGENVHPIPAALPDPNDAAARYETELGEFFQLGPGERPRFDLILLGMGADGHIASLFPSTKALEANDRLVVANWVEKLNSWRITLTLPVINHAANVIVLVSGREKSEALRQVIEGLPSSLPLPAQLLKPENGSLLWLADREAAWWRKE